VFNGFNFKKGQEDRFNGFRERKSQVEKDVLRYFSQNLVSILKKNFVYFQMYFRTDRTHPFFSGDNNQNISTLQDILMTYVMYNFDLGYVQVNNT